MKISLDDLIYATPKAWNEETRGNDRSTRSNSKQMAAGQCIVSSLLVQRHHGGHIIRCQVGGDTYSRITHYFNELDGGVTVDLTRAQFDGLDRRKPHRLFVKNPPTSTYIFNGDTNVLGTMDRVNILEDRVLEVLSWR